MGTSDVLWFNQVIKDDIPLVGGKGANLGEMVGAKIPVPAGFIVTAEAYRRFIKQSGLGPRIAALLRGIDPEKTKKLQDAAEMVKTLIMETPMPEDTALEIKEAYRKLGSCLVAVRSSATAEDLPEASFAGQQDTFLNIQGEDNVVKMVQQCWASLFEPRAIYYREQHGFDHLKTGIAVVVQRMVQSQVSGVIFTVDPIVNDTSKIVIEAIYGLGEGVVSGQIRPDLYIVDKESLRILSKRISRQEKMLAKSSSEENEKANAWQDISPNRQEQQKMSDDDLLRLAQLAKHIEEHYGCPQDIEWALEDGSIYLVQTRPVTTVGKIDTTKVEINAPLLLDGDPASPGISSGRVRIIHSPNEIHKVKKGDILVAESTTPDFVPAMKRAAAIITDRGGRTSHAAIVSRELGIPCVVGTGEGTRVLKDGQVITVDGSQGRIYDGEVATQKGEDYTTSIVREALKTRTRVYVNLAQPELADTVAARYVDGVGLLRAEFIIGEIGKHPRYMLEQGRGEEFIQRLYEGIKTFARAFSPRPVVYRTTDFKTNEYRELEGGQKFEEYEENPMLGYRGTSRYVTDIESFKLELAAIKRVREEYPNLWVMLPFVRTVSELARAKEIIEEEGLKRGDSFKLWIMVEVPSNIFLLEDFLSVGIDGISIGSNDLTQLILGIDRDNNRLADIFDERNEAVLKAIEHAIKVARSMGVTSSICGQAPSVYPDLTEKLVAWGITSVSVSPDMIGTTREIIARAEAKLGLNG